MDETSGKEMTGVIFITCKNPKDQLPNKIHAFHVVPRIG